MANTNIYTIQEIIKKIDYFSEFNNARRAYSYLRELEQFVKQKNLKQIDRELYGEYYDLSVRLKFLALEFFDDWTEIEELLKNHFESIYKIKYYDLWNKIKIRLLTVPDLNKRDETKRTLKKILLNCDRAIINKKKYDKIDNLPITVAEWLNDFTTNLGIGEIDRLKKVQYLTNSENIKKLDSGDSDKIKILFRLYENIRASSNTPEGFEDDVPMVINGKYVIYTQGQAEEVDSKIKNLIKSIKTDSKEIQELKQEEARYGKGGLEEKAIEEEIENEKRIEELRAMAGRYAEGSLERKAIEEEIRKIKI